MLDTIWNSYVKTLFSLQKGVDQRKLAFQMKQLHRRHLSSCRLLFSRCHSLFEKVQHTLWDRTHGKIYLKLTKLELKIPLVKLTKLCNCLYKSLQFIRCHLIIIHKHKSINLMPEWPLVTNQEAQTVISHIWKCQHTTLKVIAIRTIAYIQLTDQDHQKTYLNRPNIDQECYLKNKDPHLVQ